MKTLNELHQWMEDNEYFELANELAITRYKARMWDKYNREARIHKDLVQALEITETVHDARRIFEENRDELTDLIDPETAIRDAAASELAKQTDALLNPHAGDRAFHDFKPAVKEFEEHKDETGHTYTGHDEEDVPGTARKGEN